MLNPPPDQTKYYQKILHRLPKPMMIERIGDTRFSIYQAKSLFKHRWKNAVLKELVQEARKTYPLLYGDDLPLFDQDDKNAAVYLVRVHKFKKLGYQWNLHIDKWYSLRFVPSSGAYGEHAVDLKIFEYSHQTRKSVKYLSLIDIMHSRLKELKGMPKKEVYNHIVMHTRLCATPVFIQGEINGQIREKIIRQISNLKKEFYPGLCYALMCKQFLKDMHADSLDFPIMTCIMHDYLCHNVLTHVAPYLRIQLPFTSGEKMLHMDTSERLSLRRKVYYHYIYSYPGYFLDIHDLTFVLKELVEKQLLPKDIIERYLDEHMSFEKLLEKPKMYHFHKMGKLFLTKGKISGSKLTGEKLREIFDKKVKDGPRFRIMRSSDWETNIDKTLDAVRKKYAMIAKAKEAKTVT